MRWRLYIIGNSNELKREENINVLLDSLVDNKSEAKQNNTIRDFLNSSTEEQLDNMLKNVSDEEKDTIQKIYAIIVPL